jgi:tetratricopeptide (TPR) repeat protein
MSYFVLLNNYAVYYMNVRDYAAAQRIWENVLEMTPILKKENANSQWFDFVLHVNLAVLFLELQEFAEAADHLHEAQRLFPDLLKAHQAMVVDWYYSIRANHMSAMGQFENASAEIARVKNQDSLICVGARAKLHLGKQEYSQAEQLLRRLLDQQCKIGSVHRPDLLLCKLEFAKSLFGQGKHDEAFLVVGEARRIVVDFAMPANKIWRNTLLAWLHHAKELGRIDDMATLEADLQSMAPVSDHAITISAKLRVQSDNEFRGPAEE